MKSVDLNGDAGERPDALVDGREEAFLASMTSASIACGGHAGDAASMEATVAICLRLGVSIGAHPSYPDRAGFGRTSIAMPAAAVEEVVFRQVAGLGAIARAHGAPLRHLKPHGGLYHDCAADPMVAEAVARAAARWSRELVLFAAHGSRALEIWRALGFVVAAEAFADRVYEPDGSLRSRAEPGALIEDPSVAAARAERIAVRGEVAASDGTVLAITADSICVHSDTAGAEALARAVRVALRRRVRLRAP